MTSAADVCTEIVAPSMRAVFQDGEVSSITVTFDPALEEGSITLSLTAMGEEFHDVVVQGNVDGYDVADWRERLRSDLADFAAESGFGWGQNRGV